MKRFITAMLTLTLFTGLSAGKASAQGFRPVPSPAVWLAETALDEIIAIAAHCNPSWFAATTELGIIDPDDCSQLGGKEGEDLVDLWFELVDAGYAEDEAFEMIDMLMDEDIVNRLSIFENV